MLKNWTQSKILIFFSNIVLMVLSILLTLCLAEFAARHLLNPPYGDDYFEFNGTLAECDRMLGWRNKSNTVKIDETEGYVHQVVINSAGMHDREHFLKKDKDVFRILVLGDSFVEAKQVAERESSHAVIESVLNALSDSPIRYEVISAGVYMWGTEQELMYFRTAGQFYTPDLVLVFWYANDLADVLPDNLRACSGIACSAPYFAVCNGRFDTEPWFSVPGISPTMGKCSTAKKTLTSSLNYLYHHSHLYQQLAPLLLKRQSAVKLASKYSPWLENNHDEILEYAYQVTDGILTTLASEANQVGAKTAVIIVPPKDLVYYEVPYREQREMIEQIEIQYPDFRERLNHRLCNQKITTLMMAKSITVLDLQPAFVKHLQTGGDALYWDRNNHWNVRGNKMAAELIAKWLLDNQLVHISP